jgi:hypothetical protein
MEWWDYLYLNEGQSHATIFDSGIEVSLRFCNPGEPSRHELVDSVLRLPAPRWVKLSLLVSHVSMHAH